MKFYKLSAALLLLFSCLTVQAQFCAFDPLIAKQRSENNGFRQNENMFNQLHSSIMLNPSMQSNMRAGRTAYTIPIVVHIIHQNGTENISDAQVMAGIQDLNDAFANVGYYNQPSGVNTDIQFCLASQDPNGNFTTGITRDVNALTNLIVETQDIDLKNINRWDPTKYINIWLVNEITSQAMGNGVAGYAYFPTSHGQPEDGIVNEARFFGSNHDDSKVHIHEMGHYLGLYHTFEGGCANNDCLNQGDHVCDTPPDASTAAVSCGATPNTCATDDDDLSPNNPFRPVGNGGLGDQNDMFQDYMDYGYQYCQNRLTPNQSTRMTNSLITIRASLLASLGCQSICTNPIVASFTMSGNPVAVGTTVNFTNTSTGSTTWQWTINGSPFATTQNASNLFNTPGFYVIGLTASNGDPACTKTHLDTLEVQCTAQASYTSTNVAINPGGTVTFTNTSTGYTSLQWYLDGNFVGAGGTYAPTFNNAGGFTVFLIACNATCCDTSLVSFIQVGNCATKKGNTWYFGNNAGLDFNSGTPVALTNGGMDSDEGCAAMSDVNGNILFYTNGMQVWDRTHAWMSNGTGLLGHTSSSQAALIVPWPDSLNKYVIITTDAAENGGNNGARYSVVDMTLNGGNGAVTLKNIVLHQPAAEKITASYHANGRDIWVITHGKSNTDYHAQLLTPTGFAVTEVITSIGLNPDLLHCMKMSSSGKKLVSGVTSWNIPRYIEVLDFDQLTGTFSNVIDVELNQGFAWQQAYGVEFSPDNSKAYCSTWNGASSLWQIDLTGGTQPAVQASLFLVYNGGNMGAVQLGPDGKIYISNSSADIHRVDNPNNAGAACGFAASAVSLAGKNSDCSLPNLFYGMIRSTQASIIGPDSVCMGNNTTWFVAGGVSQTDTTEWIVSGANPWIYSSHDSLGIVFTNTGTNQIILKSRSDCGASTDTMWVVSGVGTNVDLGNDTVMCTGAGLLLDAGAGFNSYTWSTGANTQTITAPTAGTYSVTVTNASCSSSDQIIIQTLSPIAVNPADLGPDIAICNGGITVLDLTHTYYSYEWQDGSTNATFTAWLPGTYSVTVTDGCGGTDTDDIVISDNGISLTNLGPDTLICEGDTFLLDAGPGLTYYLWWDGTNTQTHQVTTGGTFWVEVSNANGCSTRDSIILTPCVSISNGNELGGIDIYPNPASDVLNIKISGTGLALDWRMMNSLGQVLMNGSSQSSFSIPLNEMADGVYLFELSDKNSGQAKVVRVNVLRD